MSTKKTARRKAATTKRGRRKKTATSKSLFKTGTGSSAEREAREWQEILGAETKAALDQKIEQTITGGMLSPVETLYWHGLIQERLRPCPTHLLQAVARSIADGSATLQEIVAERNSTVQEIVAERNSTVQEIASERDAIARGRAELQRSILDDLREQTEILVDDVRHKTEETRRKLAAIRTMKLTDNESIWLRWRCRPKGQNREGYTTWYSQADIAERMGIHKQAVNRMEHRLMKRQEVQEYIANYGKPRKSRGPHAKAVSNRGKVA